MFELIPSEYMREIFKLNSFELSDFNKATIIWNRYDKSRSERMEALLELSEITHDKLLKQQIRERIDFENDMLERFEDNTDRKCIYVVEDETEYSCGFFSDYNMAYEYGLRYLKKYEAKGFSISKQRVIEEEKDLTVRNPARINWNLMPMDESEKTQEYDGDPLSQVHYSQDGDIDGVWSNEMSEEAENQVDSYRSDRFESQFIAIPFEGHIGMPVKNILDGTYGVLMNDTARWNAFLEKVEEDKMYADYSDVQVMTVFLTEQGIWSHEHINPIYLEVEVPRLDMNDKKTKAFAYAFESFCDYFYRKCDNTKSVDGYEKEAIKYARQYRDICLEVQNEEARRKNSIVDRAKTIEDIIL